MQARVSAKSTDAFAAARHRELTARLQHFAEITTSLAERDQLGLVFRHDPSWSPGAHRNVRSCRFQSARGLSFTRRWPQLRVLHRPSRRSTDEFGGLGGLHM